MTQEKKRNTIKNLMNKHPLFSKLPKNIMNTSILPYVNLNNNDPTSTLSRLVKNKSNKKSRTNRKTMRNKK